MHVPRLLGVTERGPGGWPLDPTAAFHEAQGKFHEARKEADHWRSNHADLLRRFKVAQSFRSDLIEGAALLERVANESAPHLSGELLRAINHFLVQVARTLEAPAEDQSQ
jgi:hypothetical protein